MSAAGLFLALVCNAIVGTGLALALVSWQPRSHDRGFLAALVAGLTVGSVCLVLAALHSAETAFALLP